MAAVVDWDGYPARMPWCGGTPQLYIDTGQLLDAAPTGLFYFSQGAGSAGTNVTCYDAYRADELSGRTLTLRAASMWSRTNSSGLGYTIHCVNHATNYRRATTSDAGYASESFTAICAMILSGNEGAIANQGLMAKGNSDLTMTRGWGVYLDDAGRLHGWIDDASDSNKEVTLDISHWALELAPTAMVMLRFNAESGELLLRIYDPVNGSTENSATVEMTTLGLAEASYSALCIGSQVASSPGTTCYDGDFWFFGYWPAVVSDDLWQLLIDDPFGLARVPRGGELKIYENPAIGLQYTGGIGIYGEYVPENYIPGRSRTIVDCPGTPNSDYTWDSWLEYTFGRGVDGSDKDYHDFGTPDWKTIADSRGYRVLIPLYYFNGSTGTLYAGGTGGAALADAYQKVESLLFQKEGIVSAQDAVAAFDMTGWSSGGTVAISVAHAFSDRHTFRSVTNRHSTEASGADEATTSGLLGNTLNTIATVRKTWSSAPVWSRGAAVSAATIGTGAGADGVYTPAHSNTWASNAAAKLIPTISFGGSNDPNAGPDFDDDPGTTYMEYQDLCVAVMAAQGYALQRVKTYDGDGIDPQGTTWPTTIPAGGTRAFHGKARDSVEQMIERGAESFFIGVGRRRMIQDDGPF